MSSFFLWFFSLDCLSNVIMFPVTATLKCPHGTGEYTDGIEGSKEMASNGTGRVTESRRDETS
jgi:hypothetical protein